MNGPDDVYSVAITRVRVYDYGRVDNGTNPLGRGNDFGLSQKTKIGLT